MRGLVLKQGKSKRGKWTKEQKEYVDRAVADGCLVCRLLGIPGTLAAWHHQKENFHGAGMRAPHHQGIALCPYHHDKGECSVHLNPKGFARLVGMTEAELVALSQKMLGWATNKGKL